jgi:cytidine deaminase
MLPTITYPCGACRQVMAEYENIAQAPITIIIGSSRAVQVFEGVSSIMPFMFDNLI